MASQEPSTATDIASQPSAGSSDALTLFGRALQKLGIRIIYANPPQAKGRVERVNRTLQDRLPKELRLRGISDWQAGNAFLPEFMDDFNRRFAIQPRSQHGAHRPLFRRTTLPISSPGKRHAFSPRT